MILLYRAPTQGQPVPTIAVGHESSLEPNDLAMSTCPISSSLEPHFSWASLTTVTSIRVFYDKEKYFRDMILRYENGGERAVGECRLNVDAARTVDNPQALHFKHMEYVLPDAFAYKYSYTSYICGH